MEEAFTTKLGNIAKIQTGPFGSQLHQSDYVGFGIPCIMPINISDGLQLDLSGIAMVSDSDAERLKKHKVSIGDIVYSRRGDIERCAYINKENEGWLCGTGCLRITDFKQGIDSKYIALYLSSPKSKAWIVSNAVGTTMLNLNTSILSEVPIIIPSYKVQQRIVDVIDSLDSKIELNNRINHNLEEQAQALYKSWFVDFEPFKDGKFIESELGMIPEGWRVVTMGEVTTEIRTKVGNRTGIKVLSPINTGKLALSEEYFTKQVFSNSIAKYILVEPNSFAYNPARVNIGSIGMNEFPFDGCVSPVYVVFRCEDEYEYLFDFFRKGERFKTEVITRSIGGVRQTLAYKDFSMIKMVYPPAHIIRNFNSIYHTFYRKINDLENQNKKISELRDSILPKLMSGELKINKIDC